MSTEKANPEQSYNNPLCPRCEGKTSLVESGSNAGKLNWGSFYCYNCKVLIKIRVLE